LIDTPPSEHDTGVIVTELVDTFPASGDIPATAASVPDGLSDHPGFDKRGLPGRL